MAVCATFFTDLANATSRIDFKQVAEIVAPFASAVVAIAAIWMTNRQSSRTMELNKRQSDIAEAKVRADLYDRRYDAWMDLLKFARTRYLAIHGMKAGDSQLEIYSDENQKGFEAAAERVYFLFPDEVNQSVTDLKGSLTKFQTTKAMEMSADDYKVRILRGNDTLAANQEADYALANLRRLIKTYMEPSGPLQ